MKVAFMFPGQGAQNPGMGKDLYDRYDEVRSIYDRASVVSGVDIRKISFESDMIELSRTQNAQLAIATMSLAIVEVLKKYGVGADICVGLSLGEYPALIYGGYLDFNDGIRLLKSRGFCMGNMVPNEEFSMAAVIGMESSIIEETCKELCDKNEFVVPANYNYSDQTVISGNLLAVEKAMEILKENGAKKIIKLNTSGPFHTAKLAEAKEEFSKELEKISFHDGNVKVIKNIDGTIYKSTDDIKTILSNHIISPVRFDKAIKLMQRQEVNTYIEIGPGKSLSGFVRKENKDANITNICDVDTLEKALETYANM